MSTDPDTTPANDLDRPRDGGYSWCVDDSRKLDARLGNLPLPRAARDAIERQAARAGVPVSDLLAHRDQHEIAAEAAAGHAADVRERAQRRTSILLSRIPDEFRDAETRLPESDEWFDAFRAGRPGSIALLGGVGTGKTHEAYGLVRRLLLELTVPVQAVTATELRAMLRPNEDGQADVGLLQSAPVLFLDDLGAEGVSDWQIEQFEAVADFRYARRLPWIITSNLSAGEIRPRYGDRIADRLGTNMRAVDMPPLPPHLTGRRKPF